MADWNLISKLFSAIGTTAFGVGFTGMAIKCKHNWGNSIFCGSFGYPTNCGTFNYDITNPYAFLNANINQTNSVNTYKLYKQCKKSSECLHTTTLQTNVGKAQEFLQKHLANLSDTDLEKLGISSTKRDRLLKYIANIKYEDDPLHDTMHGGNKNDDYAITVNTKLQGSDNLANMVTMLIHEANHCDEAYLKDNPNESEIGDTRHRDASGNPITAPAINTKQEEKACETLGVMTCAVLIDKGVIPDKSYGRYNNHQFTEYLTNPDLLNKDIEEWCNKGYTNYIEDFDGNVTFEHMKMDDVDVSGVPDTKIQIQKGDIVKVNGKEYTIGNGIFMESSDSAPIIQFCDYKNLDKKNAPTGLVGGLIIFDGLEPTQSEKEKVGRANIQATDETVQIIRNGKVVYTGKVYN